MEILRLYCLNNTKEICLVEMIDDALLDFDFQENGTDYPTAGLTD